MSPGQFAVFYEGDRVLAEVHDGLRKKKPVVVKKAPAKKKKGR